MRSCEGGGYQTGVPRTLDGRVDGTSPFRAHHRRSRDARHIPSRRAAGEARSRFVALAMERPGPAQWGRPDATHQTTDGRDPHRRVDARRVQRRRAIQRRRATVRRQVAIRRRVAARRRVAVRRLVADRAALGSVCRDRQDARFPGRRAFVPATRLHGHVQHGRHVLGHGGLQPDRRYVHDERRFADDHRRGVIARLLPPSSHRHRLRDDLRPLADQGRDVCGHERHTDDHVDRWRHDDVRTTAGPSFECPLEWRGIVAPGRGHPGRAARQGVEADRDHGDGAGVPGRGPRGGPVEILGRVPCGPDLQRNGGLQPGQRDVRGMARR